MGFFLCPCPVVSFYSKFLPRGILLVLVLVLGDPDYSASTDAPNVHPMHPMCILRMRDVLAPTHQTVIHHHTHHQCNESMMGKIKYKDDYYNLLQCFCLDNYKYGKHCSANDTITICNICTKTTFAHDKLLIADCEAQILCGRVLFLRSFG